MESGPDLIRALTWVGGAAISLLSIFGAGGIILAFLKRYWDKGDRNRDLTDAANVERVKGENALAASTLEYFKAELTRLAERVDRLEGELLSQREMNARKDVQIENLQKENESLRQRAREQDKTLAAQEAQISAQESQIKELCLELDRLKQQVEQFGNK